MKGVLKQLKLVDKNDGGLKTSQSGREEWSESLDRSNGRQKMIGVLRPVKLVDKRNEVQSPIVREKVLRWVKSVDKTMAVLRHVKLVGKVLWVLKQVKWSTKSGRGPNTGQMIDKKWQGF